MAEVEFRIDARAAEQLAAVSKDMGQFFARVMTDQARITKEEIIKQLKIGRN